MYLGVRKGEIPPRLPDGIEFVEGSEVEVQSDYGFHDDSGREMSEEL